MVVSLKIVFYGTGKPIFMIYAAHILHVVKMFTEPDRINEVVRDAFRDMKSEFVFINVRDDEVVDSLIDISHVRIVGKGLIQSLYVMDEKEAVFVCDDASELDKRRIVEELNHWWLSDRMGWWTNFDLLFRCKTILNEIA